VWERPSIGAVWNAYSGNSYSLIGGWGAQHFQICTLRADTTYSDRGLCSETGSSRPSRVGLQSIDYSGRL
jgi:hypothetical protein